MIETMRHFIFFVMLGGLASFCLLWSGPARGAELNVDEFQQGSLGSFPDSWKTYPFQMGKAKKVYRLEQEGGLRFLRAVDDKDLSVHIFREFDWDFEKYPYLKFRWRAQKLPEVPAVYKKPFDDNACGVFVGLGFTSAMKYVWSSVLTKGSFWAKQPGKFVIISEEFGPGHVGQWQNVSINVPAEYQKYFGKPLSKKPSGIAILTDGEGTHQAAACDYADFRISDQP